MLTQCRSNKAPAYDTSLYDYDVVVLGGAFSGSSLAWLLGQRYPQARILVLEKSEQFDRKVGESTSEVAGCFLTKVLKAGEHLSREHVAKHGLHLWYNDPQGENNCASTCTEIGPEFQARLPTYQLHRTLLDQYLLDRTEQLPAVTLVRPANVRKIELADDDTSCKQQSPPEQQLPSEKTTKCQQNKDSHNAAAHKIHYKDASGNTQEVRCRWVIDASGKAALIGRKKGTVIRNEEHPVNSMWARFSNVQHFESAIHEQAQTGLKSSALSPRYNATNHLCGYGWWCWLIPLENGELSAGLTWDKRLFTPEKKETVAQTLLHHLKNQPVGKALFANAEAIENDTRTYSHLPYRSTQVSGTRWAAIGDAAGFMDPLYSQGLDYCAHSTFSALKLVEADLKTGDASPQASRDYNAQFATSYQRWFDSIYKDKYTYIGDAELMHIAYLLDIGIYFIGPVRFVYTDTEQEFASMPYCGGPGGIVAKFMAFYNKRLVKIALKRKASGCYGRRNLHQHFIVKAGFGPNQLAGKQIMRGIRLWIKAEWHALFLPKKAESINALENQNPLTPQNEA